MSQTEAQNTEKRHTQAGNMSSWERVTGWLCPFVDERPKYHQGPWYQFAIKIEDDSLRPLAEKGDYLLFHRSTTLHFDGICLIERTVNDWVIGRLEEIINPPNGGYLFNVCPVNSSIKPFIIDIDNGPDEIIGVLLGVFKIDPYLEEEEQVKT